MTEFEKYVKSDFNVSSMSLYDYNNSMTPMVIEEREMRAVSMSVFDRLMMERIIWCAGPVDDRMSTIVQAQLMFLDSIGGEDITLHVDTPGGSVKSGLGIVDVMDYIDCDIKTINTGMAASMGSILLGAGTKGKRSSLRFSKTMLHQSSGGAIGNIQDARISMAEWEKTNEILFKLLGEYTGKTAKQVMKDSTRDKWLSAEEALKYGIIDEVIGKK
jgi:ATP-dependent Clp protease protease subunit|tara:strand:- start:643 stop:1290 length:648 start_codon:yes stop_codon:yes gene_type:complete